VRVGGDAVAEDVALVAVVAKPTAATSKATTASDWRSVFIEISIYTTHFAPQWRVALINP